MKKGEKKFLDYREILLTVINNFILERKLFPLYIDNKQEIKISTESVGFSCSNRVWEIIRAQIWSDIIIRGEVELSIDELAKYLCIDDFNTLFNKYVDLINKDIAKYKNIETMKKACQ